MGVFFVGQVPVGRTCNILLSLGQRHLFLLETQTETDSTQHTANDGTHVDFLL